MERLTRKEEELMKILWKLEKAFVKDILSEYPNPKPPYNTVSSLVRVLQEKRIVGYKQYGNTYEYYPILTKEDYRKGFLRELISDYFDNSFARAVASFVEEEEVSDDEVKEIINLIKNQ